MKMPEDRVESIKNTIGMFLHIFGAVGFMLLAAVAYVAVSTGEGLNSPLLKQDNWFAYGVSIVSAIGLVIYRIKFGGIDWKAGLLLGLPKRAKKK